MTPAPNIIIVKKPKKYEAAYDVDSGKEVDVSPVVTVLESGCECNSMYSKGSKIIVAYLGSPIVYRKRIYYAIPNDAVLACLKRGKK